MSDSTNVDMCQGNSRPSVDLTQLSRILGEDDEAELIRFVGLFVDGFPELLAAIETALEERNPPALEDAAHAAKSAAVNVGAPRLASFLRRIETTAAEQEWAIQSANIDEVRSEFDQIVLFCRNRQRGG